MTTFILVPLADERGDILLRVADIDTVTPTPIPIGSEIHMREWSLSEREVIRAKYVVALTVADVYKIIRESESRPILIQDPNTLPTSILLERIRPIAYEQGFVVKSAIHDKDGLRVFFADKVRQV